MRVTLGALTFKSKQAALDHFRGILNRYHPGEEVTGQDLIDVKHALSNHPWAASKVGVGIEGVVVACSDVGTPCFFALRIDGTRASFSYKTCVCGDPSRFTDFSLACRRVVAGDVLEFKRRASQDGLRSEISGADLSWDDAQVDHAPPATFSALVSSFVRSLGLDLSAVRYRTGAGVFGSEFADERIAEAFLDWHRSRARLRIVSARENAETAALGRSHD